MTLNLKLLFQSDRREISHALTWADQGKLAQQSKILAKLWTQSEEKKCRVVGIGGPPGAGKSTLLRSLVCEMAPRHRILVLCIDPSSPLSGGALLGDRVRIHQSADFPESVFIRSIASHGASGAVSPYLDDLILVGKAAGFDLIFVEGVGSGQAEYKLRQSVDDLCLLLVPESGDALQLLKAGSLEVADLIILNKSDRPGAESLWQALQDDFESERLFKTSAETGEGCPEIARELEKRCVREDHSKDSKQRQGEVVRRLVMKLLPQIEKALFQSSLKKIKSLKSSSGLNPFALNVPEKSFKSFSENLLRDLFRSQKK